ncbi:MAG: hypothetical protein U0169_13410 [Polyangiaceae bacterium]
MSPKNVVALVAGSSLVYAVVALGVALVKPAHDGAVASAHAASEVPVPSTIDVSQTFEWTDTCSFARTVGGVTHHFAKHDFALRRSVASLGRASVVGHFATNSGARPEGYTHTKVSKGVYVKDGSIAVDCGADTDPDRFDTVVLVLPKAYKVELDQSNPYDDERLP